ncbi:activator of HSP90 ATPase [Mangrovihabitans endophyticus]|uniref:Activator of Hsp90 ATPase homolog 1-like protein n=1 Tax=Mangrovihabitans endophyticus TaxID=1751298 RepID=A0A8J3BZA4_9ACTN|nr:activator of HSP90 ATPase [Mangrovihabitans endophyticus]GGK86915.1 hypothetical protein GCM10012284_21330 [Mangrovihabitans endophyticus]
MSDERVLKPYDVQISLTVSRDAAWQAVTSPPMLRRWFGWDYDGLDAEIQHIFVTEATLIAPERMGWADGSYLEVTGDEDRCTVRAVREGPDPDDPDRYDAIEEGWRSFLVQLRHLLERRPDGERRTLYLTGHATGREALGLVDGDWTTDGPRTGWTIDAGGHLVVVATRAPLDHPDASRAEVTVSTYGLGDAEFAACREIWTKRWSTVADEAAVTHAGTPAPTG